MEKANKTNYIAQSLTGILDIVICLLLFISSIYKGGFYKTDFLFPNVIITLIGAVYLIYKIIIEIKSKEKDSKPRSKLKVVLDMFMLFLPITYTLPTIFKTYVSLPDSIFEMLRYVNLTVLYFVVRSTKNEKMYLNIFVLIAIVQSVLGIDQITSRSFEDFLNNLSTGYLPDIERLSATLQYANVTGVVISFGAIICFNSLSNILEKKDKFKYIKLVMLLFFVLLQITAIILTKSRVAVLVTLLLLVIHSLATLIYVNKKIGIYKLICIIYSVIASAVVESYIINNKFSMVYVALIILSIVFVLIHILIKIISRVLKNKVNITGIINKKYVKYGALAISVIGLCVVLFANKKLEVSALDKETVTVQRSIYDFKEGKNTLKIDIETLKEDTRYSIEVVELKEDYSTMHVAVFNYYEKTTDEFEKEFQIDDGVRKLDVYVKVQKGAIKVDEFKLNEKNVTLSYMFMPDNIMFKIKDTFAGVYGDSLRIEYVKDTFKLLKQNPIIGVGGEGFKHTYGSVQKVPYISSEAHSAILQALVEVGIIGTSVLIGIFVLTLVIIIKLIVRLKKIDLDDKKYVLTLACIYLSLLSVVIFDLAFSYAFMIYVFAISTALLVKAYIDILTRYKERKEYKSKVDWSYIKIVVLSISLVCFVIVLYFSINSYRASLIRIPNKETDRGVLQVAENIAHLELKVEQDNFDMDYIRELNEEYTRYKTLVMQGYVNASNDQNTREDLNNELNSVVIKIKENVDRMLEYEYYDKYVLKDVAYAYIENYMLFAEIYQKQFSSQEVAYAFYLNYVLKLTDRIKELNPLSKRANEIYVNMCNGFAQELENDNIYLRSDSVQAVINEFKKRV